jgi:hypothetical protein
MPRGGRRPGSIVRQEGARVPRLASHVLCAFPGLYFGCLKCTKRPAQQAPLEAPHGPRLEYVSAKRKK